MDSEKNSIKADFFYYNDRIVHDGDFLYLNGKKHASIGPNPRKYHDYLAITDKYRSGFGWT
ncbi:MAG TPA: hypothetical protein DCG34_08895 [Clostridiales bacterium]|jgi:hypothetical protein|nr:hypothetical protein [Clostridiales bacterium]